MMPGHPIAQRTIVDDEALAEIGQEMASDGVWIDPAYARANDLDAAAESRLEEAVASTEQAQMRVVLVEVDYNDDRFQGSFTSLSAWLHDDLGGDQVIYVGVEPGVEPTVALDGFGDQSDLFYAGRVAALEHPGDVVAQVERVGELVDSGDARAIWDEIPEDERNPGYSGSSGSTGLPSLSDGDGFPWLEAGVVVLLGAAAFVGVRRWRAARDRAKAEFALPPAVLRTVRQAEDRQLRQRAEAEVLALGEALGSDGHGTSREALGVWREALDHYDAARSVLDRAGSPADVVGALVLARRGDSARRAASLGKPAKKWTPPVTCYFNPLHQKRTERVTWKHQERSVEVPACADCAGQVRKGLEPDDVLDFVSGDTTVHYYRLDIGAWSQTGYGALEPDLIGALRRGRRRRGLARLRR